MTQVTDTVRTEAPLEDRTDAKLAELRKDVLSRREKLPLPASGRLRPLWPRFEAFLIPGLIAFLVGCALAYALPELPLARWSLAVPLLLVFLGIVIYGANKPENRWVIRLDFWMMFLIAGILFYAHGRFQPGPDDIGRMAPSGRVEIMGAVNAYATSGQAVIAVTRVNGKKTSGQILAYLPHAGSENMEMPAGTRILLEGRLSLPFESRIPGAFNLAEHLRTRHITAIIRHPSRVIAFETSGRPEYALQRVADFLKQRVGKTFSAVLPSPQAEILGGVVLGDRAIPVDRGTRQAFVRTGLIHVLAASGMNVGIIAAAVLWLATRLKITYRKRMLIAMAAVAFYSLLTGMPPSIQRAAAMLELALALKLIHRQMSPVFLLCVAGTLLVLTNPEHIASIGFQFSMLTTFGLLTLLPPLQDKLGYYVTRWLSGLILAPAIAQLWIWPLSTAYFNQFPIHSVALNVVALALVGPLTLIGFTAGMLSMLWPPLGMLASIPARPLLEGLLWLVRSGSAMDWAQWRVASPEPWQIAAFYGALLTLVAWIHRRKANLGGKRPSRFRVLRRRALAVLLLAALGLGGLRFSRDAARQETSIDLIPLSARSEAVLLRPAGTHGGALLIMPEGLGYFESRTLADYLRHCGIDRLVALVLLPAEMTGTSDAPGSARRALRNISTDLLVASSDKASTALLPARQRQAFPPQGARITTGTLAIEGTLAHLRFFQEQRCLLALTSQYSASDEASGCGVQAVLSPDRIQLLANAPLDAGDLQRLRYADSRLSFYSGSQN